MALFLKIIGLLFGIILIIILFFFYTSIQTAKKVATSIEETTKRGKTKIKLWWSIWKRWKRLCKDKYCLSEG